MADTNVGGVVSDIASKSITEDNIAWASNIATDFLTLSLKLINDAITLVKQNVWWLIIIAGLTYLIDEYALSRAPIPSGWVRYFLSFLIAMFFSFVWVGLFEGWLK